MTQRQLDPGYRAAAVTNATSARTGAESIGAGVANELHPGLAGRFSELADGRILVIDYLVTRPVPAVPTAELSARLQRVRPPGGVVIATIEGVECVADPRLEVVLREAGPRLCPVASALLGQLEIELARPLAWLDFLSGTAAGRP